MARKDRGVRVLMALLAVIAFLTNPFDFYDARDAVLSWIAVGWTLLVLGGYTRLRRRERKRDPSLESGFPSKHLFSSSFSQPE
jgi:MYXO-CTERM domain-containing protein